MTRPPPVLVTSPPDTMALACKLTLLLAPEARIVPPVLRYWPPFSTRPPAAVASSRPWLTKPATDCAMTVDCPDGEMVNGCVPVALTVPPALLMKPMLLLAPSEPAP